MSGGPGLLQPASEPPELRHRGASLEAVDTASGPEVYHEKSTETLTGGSEHGRDSRSAQETPAQEATLHTHDGSAASVPPGGSAAQENSQEGGRERARSSALLEGDAALAQVGLSAASKDENPEEGFKAPQIPDPEAGFQLPPALDNNPGVGLLEGDATWAKDSFGMEPSTSSSRPSVFAESASTSAWRERAGAFFSSSSIKLREAASKASTTVAGAAGGASMKVKGTWQVVQPRMAEVASRAGASVASAAGGASVRMRETWESTKESWQTKVAPRMEASISNAARVASDTGSMLRQGFIETTEKVKASRVGQKLGEMTQAGVERSQSLLRKNDWRSKSQSQLAANNEQSVFGASLEAVAARAPGAPVPALVTHCCEYLRLHGLCTPYIFENEGDSSVVRAIMKGYDQDPSMSIPLATSPLDIAQLLLVYFKCLPEPVFTFGLFAEVGRIGGGDLHHLCRLLRTLPPSNLATLHCLLGLLNQVSKQAEVNKMDAQSLAAEFAPVLFWKMPADKAEAAAERDTNGAKAAGVASPEQSLFMRPLSASDVPSPLDLDPNQGSSVSAGNAVPMVPASETAAVSPRVIVDVDGNTAVAPEIPVTDEPTHEQTSLVEAVMVMIEECESIFSASAEGPVMVNVP